MESRVLAVEQETPDTVSLTLAAPSTFCASIRPGQFIMLGATLAGHPHPVRRSYSVAGVTAESILVTVKRQEPGLFSHHATALSVGDTLDLTGPFGRHFLWDPVTHDVAVPVVFVAGGTGIAPFRLMVHAARAARFSERGGHGYVFFSVRTGADVIYARELIAQSKEESWEAAGFRVLITITRPTDIDAATWKGPLGRIGGKLLRETLGDNLSRAAYYACGPTPLVVDVQTVLATLGVPADRIKTEKYGAIEG